MQRDIVHSGSWDAKMIVRPRLRMVYSTSARLRVCLLQSTGLVGGCRPIVLRIGSSVYRLSINVASCMVGMGSL
jgi:hypothetical protein